MSAPWSGQKRWQSRLFTTSETWTVPNDVGVIWVDGCGGGGGGGGGYNGSNGGGGGGGSPGDTVCGAMLPISPGEVATITIGLGGAGGTVGNSGSHGGNTIVSTPSGTYLGLSKGGTGAPGGASAGGASHANEIAAYSFYASAGGDGTLVNRKGPQPSGGQAGLRMMEGGAITVMSGAGGGNAGANAGRSDLCASRVTINTLMVGGQAASGSGGGGNGGGSLFGVGGVGGNGLVAGNDATQGYGGGGGGGGGNAAGGNGGSGFIRIFAFSATTI